MKIKYYISKRFTENIYRSYHYSISTVSFREIVTLDSNLSPRRYEDTTTREFFGHLIDNYDLIKQFPYTADEELLICTEVHSEINIEPDDAFEFCGFDIMDYFDSNSWVTGYCLPFDEKRYNYTKYGLLTSYREALNWIDQHRTVSQGLQNGEYLIYAVWRQTHPHI